MKRDINLARVLAPILFLVFSIILLGPRSAAATVVLEQPPTIGGLGGGGSNSGPTYGHSFEDFRLAADATITGVRWHGSVGLLAGPGQFTIEFYQNDGIAPQASPFFTETVTVTGTQTKQFEFEFFAALTNPVTLLGGTNLWISIFTDEASPSFTWASASDTPSPGSLSPNLSFKRKADGSFIYTQQALAFALISDPAPVPEPGTLALFAAGLAGIGLLRRRKSA